MIARCPTPGCCVTEGMQTSRAKVRQPSRRALSLSDQSDSQSSQHSGPWLKSRPQAKYEDAFWPLARFGRLNRLSMSDAIRICHAPSVHIAQQEDRSLALRAGALFGPRYLWRNEEVRFCPICAECGWMPDLFSLPVLFTCPIHHAKLTSECCVCGNALKAREVRLSPFPFCCSYCKEPWFGASLSLAAAEGDEWPPDHAGGIFRMTLIDEAVQRLQNLRLTVSESYGFDPKRPRSELAGSLWGVTCGMRPEAQEILAAVTCGEAARDVYALAFRVQPATVFPRVGTIASVQLRIRQYLQLRSKLAAHFMTCSSLPDRASQPQTAQSTTVSVESALVMPFAFLRWRRQFERSAGAANEPFTLPTRIWDESFFHDSTVVDDDWIAYCIAEMFGALDGFSGLDWLYRRDSVRRNSVLASNWYPDCTEVRVIAAGRWPFLDELVIEYGLRISAPDLESLAEKACDEQRRGMEKLFSRTA